MFECLGKVAPHVADERVQFVGAVQRDRNHAFGLSNKDVFVGHKGWCLELRA
jgi:hypothetical protein